VTGSGGIDPAGREALAPGGTLRVGVNVGNPVLATRDSATGTVSGVAPTLAAALAAEAGLPLELVVYASAGRMAADAAAGKWDVAFLAIDPERARDLAFSAPYLTIEGVYLVSEESGIDELGDVDDDGVRIGVSAGSAYDLHLSRVVRRASLVRAPTPDAAFELILDGTVDVVAGVRQHLAANIGRIAAGRVLDGAFMSIEQAVAVPIGRVAAAALVRDFVSRASASGAVARAIADAGVDAVPATPCGDHGRPSTPDPEA
jgi:polar amino acid transport system substrate-binding protein